MTSSPAILLLVLLLAGCGIQVSTAYNSTVNHTSELVVTDDLNSTSSDFKPIFSVAERGSMPFGP
jgi:hypothetical protein